VKPPIHLIFIFVVPFYNFANNVDLGFNFSKFCYHLCKQVLDLGFSCSKFDCVSMYVDVDFSCYLFFQKSLSILLVLIVSHLCK